ncbi:MAG: hypothetical protein ACQESR_22390 [Planctomycetota bacterium]
MESCPTQAVLPLVGLAADNVIRDRDNTARNGLFRCRSLIVTCCGCSQKYWSSVSSA